jgi:hypothetical protein
VNVRELFHVKHHRGGNECTTTRRRHCSAIALTLLMLAACSSPDDIAAQTAASPPEQPATPPAPTPAEAAAFTDNAEKGEAKREFAYAWPAEVSSVPQLVTRFTAERDKLLAEQKDDWTGSLREFGDSDCVACVNRSFDKTWAVVADLPRFLSLSASFYAYTGGAHGNGAYDALVWDRETKAAIDPKAMFRSGQALQDALGDTWCKALKGQRKEKLGADYSDDGFFGCPPIADLTVLVGSSDKRAFNRIGLIAAPYVAGSYAEGTYEVTLPVTAKVLEAVKPEYREAFALGK